MFKNMKISRKITMLSAMMIIFILIVGIIGIVNTNILNKQLDKFNKTHLPSIALLLEMDRDYHQLLVAERTMIFTDINDPMFSKLKEDFNENYQQANDR